MCPDRSDPYFWRVIGKKLGMMMKFNKNKASLVIAGLSLGFAPLALADEAKTPYLTIEKTVTTASFTEQKLTDVLTSTTVISQEEIAASKAYSVADIISNTPGVEVSRNGGPGTVTSFFLRGQASINLVIMVDGVRSQTDALATVKAADIPLSEVEQIEIIRGNAGALYGEAAIGGVINIITKKGKGAPKATASVSYGSRNTKDAVVSYGGTKDGTSFFINASDYSTDGFSAINTKIKPNANPDKDSTKRKSLHIAASELMSDNVEIGMSYRKSETDAEYDSGSSFDSPTDTHLLKTKSDDLSVFGTYSQGAWSNRLTVTDSALKYRDFKNGAPASFNAVINADQTNIRYLTTYNFTTDYNYHEISGGIETTSAKYNNDGDEHKREQRGAFAGYNGNFNKADIQLNLRKDDIKATDSATVKNDAQSYLIGAGYYIRDDVKLAASQSTAFRAPSNEELFGYGGYDKLKAEDHISQEASLTYFGSNIYSRLSYFTTETDNAIVYDSSVATCVWPATRCYFNVPQLQNKGAELFLETNVSDVNIQASFVSQNPKNRQTGKQALKRAKQYGTVKLATNYGDYDIRSTITTTGKKLDTGDATISGYTKVDLGISRALREDIKLDFSIENLTDVDYETTASYNTAGRSVYLTLTYTP